MGAHRNLPKDGRGETRDERIRILRERRDGLLDLIKTYQGLPFEKRDFQEIKRLHRKLMSVRTGLRSCGELIY